MSKFPAICHRSTYNDEAAFTVRSDRRENVLHADVAPCVARLPRSGFARITLLPRTEATPLLMQTTCPHCWQKFQPVDILWVSVHPELRGDPKLGPDQQRRFLPSRFTPAGFAIDARGRECQHLACPNCHLTVPRALLELPPWFISILGTPSCGKSFYLAALTWEMRRLMPSQFGMSFGDTDAVANQVLIDYEQQLFCNINPHDVVSLGDLIRKTEEQGDMYDTVLMGEESISFPKPIMFTMRPKENHWKGKEADKFARVICIYDNAGESFLPGKDTFSNPVTRHLASSSALLFLFDPTQHPPFRQRLERAGLVVASGSRGRAGRQDLILIEAATRIRRLLNMGDALKHTKPLIVIVTKKDLWGPLMNESVPAQQALVTTRSGLTALNVDAIEEHSRKVRKLLHETTPEIVEAAENFAESVTFIGVSALGKMPKKMGESNLWGIEPDAIQPDGVTLPILLSLHLRLPGSIPVASRQPRSTVSSVKESA
jgi:hypothetical protein